LKSLLETEIELIYNKLKKEYEKNLKSKGIKLPELRKNGVYIKDAIVLCCLYKYIGKGVSKDELTRIVRNYFPNTTDVQQARHLGKQKGWYIASGHRGDVGVEIANNEYCLVNLKETYPGFHATSGPRGARGGNDFQALKEKFENRCATCGSTEGKPNFLNKNVITKLEESHMNPSLPLSLQNMIPQCQECNGAYLDKFIFDGNGRVSDINLNNHLWRKKYRAV